VPTVSELKDQARALEQLGDFPKALTIYKHILRHVEGTPAIAKLIPLYVKVGDLHSKLNEPAEAVAAYEKAAAQYAQAGAAQRVTALCEKIVRVAPTKQDVHLLYARELLEHGHPGSARDVLSVYAQRSGLDRALEALDDLAGRPNEEVSPMLEHLLDSGLQLQPEVVEETAERLSSQLLEIADAEAGELDTLERAREANDQEPEELTPPMIDFGTAPKQQPRATPPEPDEEPVTIIRGSVELEPHSVTDSPDISRDPSVDMAPSWDTGVIGPEPTGEPPGRPEEPEEQPSQAARGSIEWITQGSPEPNLEAEEAAVEPSLAEEEQSTAEAEPTAEIVDTGATFERESDFEPAPAAPAAPLTPREEPRPAGQRVGPQARTPMLDRESRPIGRPLRPTPSFMTHESRRGRKSPILYAIAGFVVGLVMGVVLMMVFGEVGANQVPATPGQPEAVDVGAATEQPPTGRDLPAAAVITDTAIDSPEVTAADTMASAPTGETTDSMASEAGIAPVEIERPDSVPAGQTPTDTASGMVPGGNAVVVDGLTIESVSEAQYQGRAGFRVVHLLDSGDQFTVESYPLGADTVNVPRSGRVTVNVTPPDTVVGILRWESYLVFASGVMPEDSLRALMARLSVGARPQ